ncbi:hypothetical protein LTR51_005107 [Lithohypha guttulata]|nr:hypothetical protein LTR51_005107 [Lithohypha guttulata]
MADAYKAATSDAPPSYDTVTGSSSTTSSRPAASSHLQVPAAHNGIPAHHRRSMEDEHRPLPEGWVRQWDPKEQHQFFVNTKADPPQSIWHHPYDDDSYLSTLTSEQRERIQEEERQRMEHYHDYDESSTSTKQSQASSGVPVSSHHTGSSSFPEELPPRTSGTTAAASSSSHHKGFGEKFKEKVTGQTKEERQREREIRDQQEREYYEAHIRFRQCMQQAQITGQPQFFAKDRNGQEIYIEPPNMMGGGGYGGRGYGYNPYTSGPYANPNARFIRPQAGYYGRPYGRGYGGGMGMPIAGGLLGAT